MWVFLSLFLTVTVQAEDFGEIYITAGSSNANGSYSLETKVQLVVRDPLGRKIGLDPTAGIQFNDVPGTNYSVESIGDIESGSPGPESIMLSIMRAMKGEYQIKVFCLDDTKYSLTVRTQKSEGLKEGVQAFSSYITSGTTNLYEMSYDPDPVVTDLPVKKEVGFSDLSGEVRVGAEFRQLGEGKFEQSLLKTVTLAEKLSAVCEKREADAHKGCEPAVNVLRLFVKRLELANKKCDDPAVCDEGPLWEEFRNKHGKDRDYDEFFKEHDKEGRGNAKDKPKRFVTDEALAIIKGDAEILMGNLAGEKPGDRKQNKDKPDKS